MTLIPEIVDTAMNFRINRGIIYREGARERILAGLEADTPEQLIFRLETRMTNEEKGLDAIFTSLHKTQPEID